MPIETGIKPELMNGATEPQEAPKSLRDIAEAAYDKVERGIDPDSGDDAQSQPIDGDGRARDARGRFAPKGEEQPGEAAAERPSPTDTAASAAKPVEPAPTGTQPPQHWSEQDRTMFARQTPEAQSFLLRRHTEMERDYTAKTQANASAVQFTSALAPVFQEPTLSGHLQQAGMSPYDAIQQWAGMHRRALNPDPRERVNLLVDMAQGMGLDPAAIFATSRQSGPALSEEEQKNPAIRYFADHLGRTSSEVQQLRNTVQNLVQGSQRAAEQQQLKVTRWGIDSFAEEKDEQGNPAHPHFDACLPQIIELFRANPNRDLREAYQTALWMNGETRQAQLDAAERSRQQRAANERAAMANRSNVRGRTVPVTGRQPADPNRPRSLREVIESAADEIGF